jgi:uncharacterized membrane-anchored protein YhcB (DUF1043 family)
VEPTEYSLGILLTAAAVAAILGIVLGWLAGRNTSAAAQKCRELTDKLDQLTQEKKTYEDEVVEHFTETAALLNNLTESYREVHNHLAHGAASLCQGRGPISMERLRNERDPAEIPADLITPRPPLDYAPKHSPDEKGMLNEEFGLERESLTVATSKAE